MATLALSNRAHASSQEPSQSHSRIPQTPLCGCCRSKPVSHDAYSSAFPFLLICLLALALRAYLSAGAYVLSGCLACSLLYIILLFLPALLHTTTSSFFLYHHSKRPNIQTFLKLFIYNSKNNNYYYVRTTHEYAFNTLLQPDSSLLGLCRQSRKRWYRPPPLCCLRTRVP